MTATEFYNRAADILRDEAMCPDRYPTELMPHVTQVAGRVAARLEALYGERYAITGGGHPHHIRQIATAAVEAYLG